MSDPGWVRVATLRTAEAFRRHLEAGGIPLEFDETLLRPAESPFAKPLEADGLRAGNRFCILPMEGWDGTPSGEPTELTVSLGTASRDEARFALLAREHLARFGLERPVTAVALETIEPTPRPQRSE